MNPQTNSEVIVKQDLLGTWQFTYTNGKTYPIPSNAATYIKYLTEELEESEASRALIKLANENAIKTIKDKGEEIERSDKANKNLTRAVAKQSKELQKLRDGIENLHRSWDSGTVSDKVKNDLLRLLNQ